MRRAGRGRYFDPPPEDDAAPVVPLEPLPVDAPGAIVVGLGRVPGSGLVPEDIVVPIVGVPPVVPTVLLDPVLPVAPVEPIDRVPDAAVPCAAEPDIEPADVAPEDVVDDGPVDMPVAGVGAGGYDAQPQLFADCRIVRVGAS
jgi:hypothetical protein